MQYTHKLDYLNILLMLLSCAIAYIVPWQLLLAAYAILGPAHYLTQISWLHDRQYFTRQPNDYLYLVLLCTAMFLFPQFYSFLLIITLCAAPGMAFFQSSQWRLLCIASGMLLAIIVTGNLRIVLILALVPTLIHVYLFTAGFMLNGALKNRSWLGFLSVMMLISCAASFFMFTSVPFYPAISGYVVHNMRYFENIGQDFMRLFGLSLTNQYALAVIRFTAFAYTYHYLNWFSKTGIIKWHEISSKRVFLICGLYAISLAFYFYNYQLGFMVLLSLSFLHVILELPLDALTFRSIAHQITK